MSVLNKTLQNLEQRKPQSPEANLQQEVAKVAPVLDFGEKLHKFMFPTLVIVTVLLLGYIVYKKDIVADFLSGSAAVDIANTELEAPTKHNENSTSSEALAKESAVESSVAEPAGNDETLIVNDETPIAVKPTAPKEVITKESLLAELTDEKPTTTALTNTTETTHPLSQPEKKTSQEAVATMKQVAQVTAEQQADEHFQAGKKAFTFGLVKEAISQLQKCIAVLPEHIECRSLLAAAFYGRQDTGKASELLEQGLSITPNSMEWRTLLAKIYVDGKQYREVLSVLSQQYEEQAETDFWILKGIAAQRLELHETALRSFKKVVEAEPGQGKWWVAMGSSAEALNQWQKASQYYTTATQVGALAPASQRYAAERLRFIRGQLNAS